MSFKPGARRAWSVVAASLVLVLAASTGLFAAPRARLSQDLSQALQRGDVDRFDVIVQGGSASVDAAAARYGAQVKKRLRTGAVLAVSREALEAMSADPTIGHVAGDAPVQSMMAVTASAIGADQVWAGDIPAIEALTGRGVGIAIVDSGVSNHESLRGRLAASFDFTGPRVAARISTVTARTWRASSAAPAAGCAAWRRARAWSA